jgi:hypothetical protein
MAPDWPYGEDRSRHRRLSGDVVQFLDLVDRLVSFLLVNVA